jgi:beta-N-acetylhexosaminidase
MRSSPWRTCVIPAVSAAVIAGCAVRGAAREPPVTSGDWAERTLRQLTLRQKAAQLVMPRIGGEYVADGTAAHERMLHWVQDLGIGGVIVTVGPPLEMAAKLNMLQAHAPIPLLVTADMEHGPGQVLNAGTILPYGLENGGGTRFPPLMALGATGDERYAYELGRITALEARAAGVHVTFAPVVDVNNNPANPIINTRSYGADPAAVGRMATAHIRGLQEHGLLATAKHFPGHGDTGTDSHIQLPYIQVDRARVDAVELPPYRAAFAAGVAGVMSAHIAFPALTGDSVPATLSRPLLTTLLRDELDFDGLVFTDALDMGAIVEGWGSGTAAVMALQAGADVLLQMMPDDVATVIDAIVHAVERGDLDAGRIDASVLRVLGAKQRLGLPTDAQVDMLEIPRRVGIPGHLQVAAAAAQRSITAVRDRQGLLPLRGSTFVIVYAADRDPFAGRAFQRELSAGAHAVESVTIDARTDAALLADIGVRAGGADVVVFAPFISVAAGKTSLAVAPRVADLVNDIAARQPLVLTSFGTPYILDQFPDAGTFVLAWAQWDPLQRAAARALLGRAPVTGRLPIPLPPHHALGDGIDIAAVKADQ